MHPPTVLRLAPRAAFALALATAFASIIWACSLVPGASLSPREATLRSLAEHQALWLSKNIDDYTFTVTRSCFCPFTGPYEVTVVDGVVKGVTKAGAPVEPVEPVEVQFIPKTVLELFGVVAAQVDAASLEVTYEPTLGYPTSIVVDSIANAIDDEFTIEVSKLTPAS